jgi:hypothetical protein
MFMKESIVKLQTRGRAQKQTTRKISGEQFSNNEPFEKYAKQIFAFLLKNACFLFITKIQIFVVNLTSFHSTYYTNPFDQ